MTGRRELVFSPLRTGGVGRSLGPERTLAGVKAAQRRGVKFGRKVKLKSEQLDHARKLIDKGEARRCVADLLNVGRPTLYLAQNLEPQNSLGQFSVGV
jgi:DNA invertase Pin-like site-specific DNA recombinase